MSRRIGLMGGTFDPIHAGHLVAASEAADQAQLDEVLFVPSGQPWQKTHRVISASEHRAAMVALAIESDTRFSLNLMEINRSGPSFTIDTVNEVSRAYPSSEVLVIVGSDAAKNVNTWHQAQALIDDVHFLVMARSGHQISRQEIPMTHATVIDMPELEISSSDIRRRVTSGHSIRYLLPDCVADYIDKHQLYR